MALTQPSSRPETGFSWRHRNVPLLLSSFLSSPISLSKEGTKMGWENMLFHWVKIYYQGNDSAISKKGLWKGVAFQILLDVFSQCHPVRMFPFGWWPFLHKNRDIPLSLCTQVHEDDPLFAHSAREQKTQKEGRVIGGVKVDHIWLWNSVRHTYS